MYFANMLFLLMSGNSLVMTTLICSGTLFSGWRDALKKLVPADSFELPTHTEISALAKEICQQQYPDMDELRWKPFTPDNKYINKAGQLLSSVKNEPLFTWADNNNCLYLNFCKTISEDVKFVLFYSSPEFELSNDKNLEKTIMSSYRNYRA